MFCSIKPNRSTKLSAGPSSQCGCHCTSTYPRTASGLPLCHLLPVTPITSVTSYQETKSLTQNNGIGNLHRTSFCKYNCFNLMCTIFNPPPPKHVFLSMYIYGMHCNVTAVGPCHHGMARSQVADRGTASDMEGGCE